MESSSRHNARRLIESISRELTLDGAIIGTRLESLVSGCLETLSSQLYAKSTHFLLELIQNADDNTYECPKPNLSFSYKPGSLRIDCNEVGFTAANVEALCAINRSTKSGKTCHGEYIGEKGIGFKSVFKAADVVWISSGDFTFKFDKAKSPLGMVTPIWANFPEPTLPGYTSMYLQLSKDYNEETLVHELLTFDTNLLIFLRRIEEISLRVIRQGKQEWEKRIRKTENRQVEDRVVDLHDGGNIFQYLIRTHVIKDLPTEKKRLDWPETSILLAFPISKTSEKPRLVPQNVYAFLPVRDYGLKFLLQGDFLLAASREDIEGTLPWNIRLRDAVAEAFILSIHHFNKGRMKYIWPYYLPSTLTAAYAFFEPAVVTILTQLREIYVLESCAGIMAKPYSLKHVPLDQFADGDGIPFTLGQHTAANYLSLKYPTWAVEAINSIGVSQLSPREFLEDLNSSITQDPEAFRTRPATWHSQLAATLIKLGTDDDLMSMILDICLIPLHDGSWTSARGQSMFFSKAESNLEIPSGIEVLIVDSTAESDPNRRKLFANLGVKAWEASEICRLVLGVHGSSNFKPQALTRDQLISHAVFLWKASWQPPKGADLWFATTRDEHCLGRKLYIPGSVEADSAAARIFGQLKKQFAVIHGDYLEAFPSDADWPGWLVRNLGLSMIPRLVTPHVDPKPQPARALRVHQNEVVAIPAGGRSRNDNVPDVLENLNGKATSLGQSYNQYNSDQPNSNHALHDYQMQLMLLEQQNKKRLRMARQERPGRSPEPQIIGPGQAQVVIGDTYIDPDRPGRRKGPLLNEVENDTGTKEASQLGPPSTPVSDVAKIFELSEEFTFMFRECHTSDVLQTLRDNWQHYSQWIDGAHMKWQNPEFLNSSTWLRNSLRSCLVQSAKGSVPLQEAVLPMIDLELDNGCLIPAVNIQDPRHPDWRLLNIFDVIISADIHYYLRCLFAIAEEACRDIDKVAYIYEKIQARYKGNERLISAAFRERDIVLIHTRSRRTTKPARWSNMNECISMRIDIKSEYPNSSYLFQCLASPAGDPIAAKVAAASFINSSTKLEVISRFFYDLTATIEDVNTTKASQLLRPLHNKPIFPITDGLGKSKYDQFDQLLDLKNSSWFIADQPDLRDSFLNKLPLLALRVEDVASMRCLLCVLRLEGRILSQLTTSRTCPKGRVTTHWAYTACLRGKAPFIKVPTIERQIDGIRVNVATEVAQTFTLNLFGAEIHGSPIRGQVSLCNTGRLLSLVMTEECAAAKTPPYELVKLMADFCGIKDSSHFSLLYMALGDLSLESISSTFAQHGLHPKGLVFGKSVDKYLAQSDSLIRIPSPFSSRWDIMKGSSAGRPVVMRCDPFRGNRFHSQDGDRRVPMIRLLDADWPVFGNGRLTQRIDEMDRRDYIQHLGEHMMSKVLQTYLGQAYNLERDWTSCLRSRSGHKPFDGDLTTYAAFTMRDPLILGPMTRFVLEYGRSQTPDWKENLRANPPVYHLELAVSSGSKTSSFVFCSSQLERMRQFRMRGDNGQPNKDISVLVRVSDAYSDNELSVELFVDPWRLFSSDELALVKGWYFMGALQESNFGTTRKRRKCYKLSASWAIPATPKIRQSNSGCLHRGRKRDIYTHKPLSPKHFRLLYLLPGEKNHDLQGVVVQVPYELDDAYRTLSYVWGTDKRTEELITPDGVLQITPSLNEALRRLRHRKEAILLWVDAICINQDDNAEKAQQIRLLPTIFQRAELTYAFLGDCEGVDAAMEMLMQIRAKASWEELSTACSDTSARKSGLASNSDDWPENLARVPASWEDRCIPLPDDAIWNSVEKMFSCPWFRRVWVIQEVVVASHVSVVCGKWIVDWSDLHFAIEIVDREVQVSESDRFLRLRSSWEPFLTLAGQREWEARHHRWAFISLLENFRHVDSTLSRDRFFALLGLALDANDAEFDPDYDSPLEEIVLRVARVFVRQGRGMQLLYRAGLNEQSHRFPSWIPDWTKKLPGRLYDSDERDIPFAASGPQNAQIRCISGTDELAVEGYAVDVIKSTSGSSNLEEEWNKYFEDVDVMIDSATLAVVPDSRENLKWKVPIAGVENLRFAASGDLDLQPSYMALRRYLEEGQKGKAVEGVSYSTAESTQYAMVVRQALVDSHRKQSERYIAALQGTVPGWRFVVTEKGYVGVAPNLAQIGDVIAILKGGSVPFILRKSVESLGAFRLVGDCYIHGIMHGEGLLLEEVVENEFRLH
ncbi:hypothetical protein HD806DRAFT_549483 [Xylariaceae sp. AK1471]|nr:hypothetical protein HD806DRAFT_549483 [Xylariaceae sp. AK1471]